MLNFLWKNIFNQEEKSQEEILKSNPLFASLSKKELKLVFKMIHQRSFVPGEFIFQPGKGLGMYILLSGKVRILHKTSAQKELTVISQLEEGDFFGELALVQEKGYHNVSAQAFSAVNVLGFFRPDLINLSEKNPVTGVKILSSLGNILGERLQKSSEKIIQLSQKMET